MGLKVAYYSFSEAFFDGSSMHIKYLVIEAWDKTKDLIFVENISLGMLYTDLTNQFYKAVLSLSCLQACYAASAIGYLTGR